MPVLSQHVYLVAELLQQLFRDFGVEQLFNRHLQALISAPVDHTEPAHRYLLKDLELVELNLQDSFHVQIEGVLAVLLVLERYLLQLFLQLPNFALLALELVLHFYDFSEGLAASHLRFIALEPGWRLH